MNNRKFHFITSISFLFRKYSLESPFSDSFYIQYNFFLITHPISLSINNSVLRLYSFPHVFRTGKILLVYVLCNALKLYCVVSWLRDGSFLIPWDWTSCFSFCCWPSIEVFLFFLFCFMTRFYQHISYLSTLFLHIFYFNSFYISLTFFTFCYLILLGE